MKAKQTLPHNLLVQDVVGATKECAESLRRSPHAASLTSARIAQPLRAGCQGDQGGYSSTTRQRRRAADAPSTPGTHLVAHRARVHGGVSAPALHAAAAALTHMPARTARRRRTRRVPLRRMSTSSRHTSRARRAHMTMSLCRCACASGRLCLERSEPASASEEGLLLCADRVHAARAAQAHLRGAVASVGGARGSAKRSAPCIAERRTYRLLTARRDRLRCVRRWRRRRWRETAGAAGLCPLRQSAASAE
jgi:hypothetical protein